MAVGELIVMPVQAVPERKYQQWWLPRYERFLVPALLLFLAGNAAAWALPQNPLFTLPLMLSIGAFLLGIALLSRKPAVIKTAFWLTAFLIGGVCFGLLHFEPGVHNIAHQAPQNQVTVTATIIQPETNPARAEVAVSALNGQLATGRVLVTFPSPEAVPAVGSTVRLAGDLYLPDRGNFPGDFDYRAYLKTRHITALMNNLNESQVLDNKPANPYFGFQRTIQHLRTRIHHTFSQVLPSPDAEVLGGIVLGRHAIPVDADTKSRFTDTGLIHLLAASGLNVGIVAAFVFWLGKLVGYNREMRLVLAMAAVVFYAVLTGLPPSIQRAAAMLEIALLLKLLHKQLSPRFLLCIAATALVVWDPMNIANLGFQLSVLSTFGIITMVPPLQEALGRYITRRLAAVFLVPVVAQLWVLPVTVYHFNQFPLHSVPLNILALITVLPLTITGFVAGTASIVSESAGAFLTWAAWPFLKILLGIVGAGSRMDWAITTLASPPAWYLLLSYGLLFAFPLVWFRMRQQTNRGRVWTAVLCMGMLILPLGIARRVSDRATYVDVIPLSHRSAAMYLKPAGSNAPLIVMPADAGYWDARTVLDYLKRHNTRTLAGLVLTMDEPVDTGETKPGDGISHLINSRSVAHVFTLGGILFDLPEARPLPPGSRLRLGNIRFHTAPPDKQPGQRFTLLLDNGFCIAGVSAPGSTTDCPISYYRPKSGQSGEYRLFANMPEAPFLDSRRFYRFSPQASRLLVQEK